MKNKKLLVNIDINSVTTPFLNAIAEKEAPQKEDLYPFVDSYRDKQVTDVIFDVFCQYSATDSTVFDTYADIYLRREENGIPVDHRVHHQANYRLQKQCGLDPYQIWFERCKEVGIRPWMSIRMNDCHCPDEETCFLRTKFFYEARENGWCIGKKYGYYRYCFDYAIPEVRQKMLDYVSEQILRYDVPVLELDFLREPFCFDYIEQKDAAEIMNGFMRQVRAAVTAAEQKHGHAIELSVRLIRDVDQNLVLGYDARTWVKEGLVDSITVTPRWATCDSDMPLEAWRQEFPNVKIYAGIEVKAGQMVNIDTATTQGFAANYLAQPIDGIYLFNYFVNPFWTPEQLSGYVEIFSTCASLDTLKDKKLRYVLTEQDLCPVGCVRFKPLPMTVDKEAKTLSVKTSPLTFSKATDLILGMKNGTPNDLSITFQGTELTDFTVTQGTFYLQEKDVTYFRLPLPANDEIYKTVTLTAKNNTPVTVWYAEVEG